MRTLIAILIAVLAALATIAYRHAKTSRPAPANPQTNTSQKVYFVKGIIKELLPGGEVVKIQHEAIPGYMTAMTMPFEVKDTNELTGLKAGDLVTFHMVVTLDDGWIEKVVKIGTQTAPAPEPIRIMRDVEPLKEGDRLPDYRFTNELGQAVQLGQFKGQALVLAFFYTRCPYPDFCPRTSKNLAALVEQLKRRTDAPTNWHVLSLSFDPGFDTVPVLKAYARQYQADPRRWNFLTGAIAEIDAITEQFGMLIARGETGFDHNLRTVVVDATGKIQKIIPGNKWQPAELAGEVIKAAHPR